MIFDIELQTGPKKQRTEETAEQFQKRRAPKNIVIMAIPAQIKDLLKKNVSLIKVPHAF